MSANGTLILLLSLLWGWEEAHRVSANGTLILLLSLLWGWEEAHRVSANGTLNTTSVLVMGVGGGAQGEC